MKQGQTLTRGRGKSQRNLDLIDAARRILAEIQPATIRAVCYRLFTEGMIRDMSKAETNRVSTQLVYARENDLIPWEWVVDETRQAERVHTWPDLSYFIEAVKRSYRRDYWEDQPYYVEVWSEKGTVRGTLSSVLEKYGVTFRVMHGFASATSVKDITNETDGEREFVALYVGDWDPSGLYMSEIDLPDRLAEYGGEVTIERVALTGRDTQDGNLPSFAADTKWTDTRWRWYRQHFGPQCWELDALSPRILRRRVEQAISGYINWEAWGRSQKKEKAELKRLHAWVNDGESRNAPWGRKKR